MVYNSKYFILKDTQNSNNIKKYGRKKLSGISAWLTTTLGKKH